MKNSRVHGKFDHLAIALNPKELLYKILELLEFSKKETHENCLYNNISTAVDSSL